SNYTSRTKPTPHHLGAEARTAHESCPNVSAGEMRHLLRLSLSCTPVARWFLVFRFLIVFVRLSCGVFFPYFFRFSKQDCLCWGGLVDVRGGLKRERPRAPEGGKESAVSPPPLSTRRIGCVLNVINVETAVRRHDYDA
ncbi:unnamed protein product, partial [Hapterophycus canaliculatus]